MIRLNPDAAVVAEIRAGLAARGGYCPCRVGRDEANKCICEEFRRQMEDPTFHGYCHCGLYYKE